jgi:glycosyltransferase involved in cell wall biosynthesis
MTYRQAKRKFLIEQIGMFPFVLLGRLFGILAPLKTKHRLFLFYASADIGGAPKVNADIAECLKEAQPLIIFSKKPRNNRYRQLFNIDGVRVIDLHVWIDKKIFHFINFFFRGILASWINNSENAIVFGGESLFFYKVIPNVKKNIPCIELCHLATWLPYSIGWIDRIDKRIFSTLKLKEDVVRQYDENNIRKELYNRLYFFDNAIDIPEYKEVNNEKLEVVFIGRGAPQKRVHLIAAMAKQMHTANGNVHFSFVGDVEKVVDINNYPYCTFYGNVSDEIAMQKIYEKSDVLILTSAYEGLPLVVMKMMAYGKIVVSTAVGGIPDYIKHLENGLLIYETEEDKIVEEGIRLLRMLIANPELKKRLGKNNRQIAIEKFDRNVFCRNYREIVL